MKRAVRRLALVTTVAALATSATPADATLINTCYEDQASAPWVAPKTTIPVYLNNSGSTSAPAALGMTEWDASMGILRALNIWNEQSGSSIKLRYVGTTSETWITDAIVVYGNADSTNCPDAAAYTSPIIIGEIWFGSAIELEGFVFSTQSGACGNPGWVNTPVGGTDLVQVLVHELGHAAYNIAHPTGAPGTDCEDIGEITVMRGDSLAGGRNLGNWDLEVAQQRYGVRAQYSQIYKAKKLTDTTWSTAIPATGSTAVRPLFRMGSLTNNTNARVLGWVDGATLTDGGAGQYVSVSTYAAGLPDWAYQAVSLGRPVALASKPSSTLGIHPPTDILLVYERFLGANIYTDINGSICYRLSSNGGATWGAESCPGWATKVYGLSAAYDPRSNAFMVGFVQSDLANYNSVYIATIPATGSTTPSQVTELPVSALHAPSIACTPPPRNNPRGANRCLVAYETASGNGSLGGTFVTVNPSTGFVSLGSSYTWSLYFFDTPGLTYVSADANNANIYRLAQASASNAIYSYRMSDADPSLVWYGTGDIWNDPTSQISTGVVSVRYAATTGSYAWFVKYW